ncbi:uncharacterized protein THITE_2125581 [Thermothielavioides terrestris NRRL 8126]|uniref:Uncharacterized protein n=1 Tax=Thermothielavioides terrestris (strain ATCC 38088 / NRRL 8126) TaxID=578455 RepID=G2QVM6_THETT|nr:uncharacterized protein THITE_2125581 [Thermothielavioides terrestris NRRL 8126]AEO63007.1 hypothetical protein THITE_2125581 [Thermothielavioides terrestris NRRL 8126]
MHLPSLAAFGWTPRLFLRDENARDSGKLEIWAVNGVRSLPLQKPPALNCGSSLMQLSHHPRRVHQHESETDSAGTLHQQVRKPRKQTVLHSEEHKRKNLSIQKCYRELSIVTASNGAGDRGHRVSPTMNRSPAPGAVWDYRRGC